MVLDGVVSRIAVQVVHLALVVRIRNERLGNKAMNSAGIAGSASTEIDAEIEVVE